MHRNEFTGVLEQLQRKEKELNITKGREYCDGDEDVLANLKDVAQDFAISGEEARSLLPQTLGKSDAFSWEELAEKISIKPRQVLLVYLKKHLNALIHYCKTGEVLSEDFFERVVDIRLYTALLFALYLENQEEDNNDGGCN